MHYFDKKVPKRVVLTSLYAIKFRARIFVVKNSKIFHENSCFLVQTASPKAHLFVRVFARTNMFVRVFVRSSRCSSFCSFVLRKVFVCSFVCSFVPVSCSFVGTFLFANMFANVREHVRGNTESTYPVNGGRGASRRQTVRT